MPKGPNLVSRYVTVSRRDSRVYTGEHEPPREESQTHGVHGRRGVRRVVQGIRDGARVSVKVVNVRGEPVCVDERVADHERGRRREHRAAAPPVRGAVELLPRCRVKLPRGERAPQRSGQRVRQRGDAPELVILCD